VVSFKDACTFLEFYSQLSCDPSSNAYLKWLNIIHMILTVNVNRHINKVSTFYRRHWLHAKLFRVDCVRDKHRVTSEKKEKNAVLDPISLMLQIFRENKTRSDDMKIVHIGSVVSYLMCVIHSTKHNFLGLEPPLQRSPSKLVHSYTYYK